ncbi:hypothetical protein JW905_08210, partial [bacterium]|nr:hypothetical protein [candidate division CSSED10-310 bacterium]
PSQLTALSMGLSTVLALYDRRGLSSFNVSLHSGSLDGGMPGCPVVTRIISRQNMASDYRNDDYFVQKMLGEELVLQPPEELAEELRATWSKDACC